MDSLLDGIDSPRDLLTLDTSELRKLSEEIRDELVATVSRTGGHLAANLGVVELTIALHLVLDSPPDKIIWDVGHQSYVHKLLTGRRERFGTLRQRGGLSGFATRAEGEQDPYGAGHGSTSISAALGFVKARDLRGGNERVVAVIGDGALSSGLAFEGLNHAGDLGADLLVVLNDNEMSISRNVGAMATYLSRIRLDPGYRTLKREVASLMQRLPLGDAMVELADKFEEGVRNLVVPGALFEHLGFTYLGPIDGHDVEALRELLEQAVSLSGPVLFHIQTEKGKGYRPAERDPRAFHGTPPFDPDTGRPRDAKGPPAYGEVMGSTAVELARDNDKIVAITAAMMDGTGLDVFADEFPDRCFDVGMCEEHAVTFAAGLAAAGFRPLVAVYSTFLQRAYDQLLHDVCLQRLPVVFVLDRAGLVGDDGPTHHGVFDLSYLRHLPHMVCMAPRDEAELRQMLATAFDLDGPVAIRYPRGAGPGASLDQDLNRLEVGRAEIVRPGDDAAIVAVGSRVQPALHAAEAAEADGLRVAVVNARFVKPLDAETIMRLAGTTGRLMTVEENVLAGGFGSAVLELLADKGLVDVVVRRLGLPDRFIEHGATDALLAEIGLDQAGILQAVRELCSQEAQQPSAGNQSRAAAASWSGAASCDKEPDER
jgi:1-deoxy-D-xylulose-5-phosphate synthase